MSIPTSGYFGANDFVTSAGCILLKPLERDPSNQQPRLATDYTLIYIKKRENGHKVLAKGRKDIHETLQEAAQRESYEETGYKCTIIPLPTPTLAPSTSNAQLDSNLEPIGVTLKIDGMSKKDEGVLVQKFIYWFVAEVDVDNNGLPVSRVEGTQLEYEQYDVCEMPLEQAISKDGLDFKADRHMVDLTIKLLSKRLEIFKAKASQLRTGA